MGRTNPSSARASCASLLVDGSERSASRPTAASSAHLTLLPDAAFGRTELPGRGCLSAAGAVRDRVRGPVAALGVALVARDGSARHRVAVQRIRLVLFLLELLLERRLVSQLFVRRGRLLEAFQRRRRDRLLLPLCRRNRRIVVLTEKDNYIKYCCNMRIRAYSNY